MKRSKMVDFMTSEWLGLFPKEAEQFYCQDLVQEVKERMSTLLAAIEYKGMKPPVDSVDPIIFTTKHVWTPEHE